MKNIDRHQERAPVQEEGVPLEFFELDEVFKDATSVARSERLDDFLYFLKDDALWCFNAESKKVARVLHSKELNIPNSCLTHILWVKNQYLLLGLDSEYPTIVLIELTKINFKLHLSLSLPLNNFNISEFQRIAVSPSMERMAMGSHSGHIVILSLVQESPEFIMVKAYEDAPEDQPLFAISALKFIDNDHLVSAHLRSKNISCWQIRKNAITLLWSYTHDSFLAHFYPNALCFLSDRVLFKSHKSYNTINSVNLNTGDFIESIPTSVPQITSITKINDDRVAICGGQGRLNMEIMNIRTKTSLWLCRSTEPLIRYIPSQLFVLSPTCLLSSDELTSQVWQVADQTQPFPIARNRINNNNEDQYSEELFPMKGGRVVVLQNDRSAYICKPRVFFNPFEENDERRITAALCLACLVHKNLLKLDNIIHILTFITTGYESELGLKLLRPASNKLASNAFSVLSKFFMPAEVVDHEKLVEDEVSCSM